MAIVVSYYVFYSDIGLGKINIFTTQIRLLQNTQQKTINYRYFNYLFVSCKV